METTPGQVVGLGWLRGTVRGDPETVLRTLSPWFGEPVHREGGTRWYRESWTFPEHPGVMVAGAGVGNASGTVLVDVKQTPLDGLGWAGSMGLARALLVAGLRASRVDVYCDDRAVSAYPADVWSALCRRDVVTHANVAKAQHHEGMGGSETVYLGVRESERLLRVYRKPDELGDRVRWEMETHDEGARHLLALLASLLGTDDLGRTFWGYLTAFVDFRAEGRAGADGNGARRPRLAWFAELVAGAPRIRGRFAAPVTPAVERAAGWIARQVAPSLAWAFAEYGEGWLNAVVRDGWDRAESRGLAWARR